MNRLASVLACLLLTSCAQATPATEEPSIVTQAPSSRIVQYDSTTNGHLEAWEIVNDWVDGTYLNYSRFPYGDLLYQGQPTWICSAVVSGQGIATSASGKYAGVSEDPERLKKALNVVIKDQIGHPVDNIKCEVFSDVLKRNPHFANIRTFFYWL